MRFRGNRDLEAYDQVKPKIASEMPSVGHLSSDDDDEDQYVSDLKIDDSNKWW